MEGSIKRVGQLSRGVAGLGAPLSGAAAARLASLARLVDVVLVLADGHLAAGGLGLLVGNLGSRWGEVLIPLSNHSGNNDSGLWRTAASLVFLLIIVVLFWGWGGFWG